MVRLKVSHFLAQINYKRFQFLMVRLKGLSYKILFLELSSFQFLMVRLKETNNLDIINFYKISIPYGAIKSKLITNLIQEKYPFQFLMVRLKAYVEKPLQLRL